VNLHIIKEYGLIGYPLSHSFSKKYFNDKFIREGITDCSYDNFPIEHIDLLPKLFEEHPILLGLNVTIPYKETVITYLDALADDAAGIRAVNTIKRYPDGQLKGFNSDIYGFAETLNRFVPPDFDAGVLILGTGGASKAVRHVCQQRGLAIQYVSRKASEHSITYAQLKDSGWLEHYRLIVNTTPLGMHPKTGELPGLPYDRLTPEHYLIDLIYNPEMTRFLEEGLRRGCQVKNGMEMLILQAEKSWEIWNDPHC
jgi:shikimate dehydrogenase